MSSSPKVKVHFFNVGQGNSILIEFPDSAGKPLFGVIDCFFSPKSAAEPVVLSYLKSRGIDELEFVALTHPDKDHYYGLSRVLNHYSSGGRKFKRFIQSVAATDLYKLHKYAPRILTATVPIEEVSACAAELEEIGVCSTKAQPDKGTDSAITGYAFRELVISSELSIQFVAPIESVARQVVSQMVANLDYCLEFSAKNPKMRPDELPEKIQTNSVSLALLVRYGEGRLLVCGDVMNPQWSEILRRTEDQKINLESDLISVTHHGGEGNPRKLWQRIVRKDKKSISVISCGYDNQYGHPQPTVLNRILAASSLLLCTNKGAPCCFYDVKEKLEPFEAALADLESSLSPTDVALKALGAADDICSGSIEISLDKLGGTDIVARDQKAKCVYASNHGMNNDYPAGK